MPGKLHYGEVIRWLSERLPDDTIVAGGAGNFAGWLHRHFATRIPHPARLDQRLEGYGYPAAIAAKLARPARPVLALCGDATSS